MATISSQSPKLLRNSSSREQTVIRSRANRSPGDPPPEFELLPPALRAQAQVAYRELVHAGIPKIDVLHLCFSDFDSEFSAVRLPTGALFAIGDKAADAAARLRVLATAYWREAGESQIPDSIFGAAQETRASPADSRRTEAAPSALRFSRFSRSDIGPLAQEARRLSIKQRNLRTVHDNQSPTSTSFSPKSDAKKAPISKSLLPFMKALRTALRKNERLTPEELNGICISQVSESSPQISTKEGPLPISEESFVAMREYLQALRRDGILLTIQSIDGPLFFNLELEPVGPVKPITRTGSRVMVGALTASKQQSLETTDEGIPSDNSSGNTHESSISVAPARRLAKSILPPRPTAPESPGPRAEFLSSTKEPFPTYPERPDLATSVEGGDSLILPAARLECPAATTDELKLPSLTPASPPQFAPAENGDTPKPAAEIILRGHELQLAPAPIIAVPPSAVAVSDSRTAVGHSECPGDAPNKSSAARSLRKPKPPGQRPNKPPRAPASRANSQSEQAPREMAPTFASARPEPLPVRLEPPSSELVRTDLGEALIRFELKFEQASQQFSSRPIKEIAAMNEFGAKLKAIRDTLNNSEGGSTLRGASSSQPGAQGPAQAPISPELVRKAIESLKRCHSLVEAKASSFAGPLGTARAEILMQLEIWHSIKLPTFGIPQSGSLRGRLLQQLIEETNSFLSQITEPQA